MHGFLRQPSPKEKRERFRSLFPNQYTGYERWQIWASVPAISSHAISHPPSMQTCRWLAAVQRHLLHARWNGCKIIKIDHHTIDSNSEFQINQIHIVIVYKMARTLYLDIISFKGQQGGGATEHEKMTEMARWAKGLTAKPENLRSVPIFHVWRRNSTDVPPPPKKRAHIIGK